MQALTLSEVAVATGGQKVGEEYSFDRVSTDTRTIPAGSLFVALEGEHFDGNDFVDQAQAAGAGAAVVSRSPSCDLPHVRVHDSRFALGQIASLNRQAFERPLIAITGSSGKTSCKEMLAAILRQAGSVLATQGNLNNEIGVPLTLLQLSPDHDYAVIEMGASARGDIRYLCDFAHPDVAVLTNAQPAHLEGFGDLETVAHTKGEIYEALRAQGTAIINWDDAFCELWQGMASDKKCVFFSIDNTDADIYARGIRSSLPDGQCFVLVSPQGEVKVHLPLLGRHMIGNALAAAAAALSVGITLEQVSAGLASVQPVAGRLMAHQLGGLVLVDDSYNANPGSVRAAITMLAQAEGRRLLVFGHMAELGEGAEREHRDVAAFAREAGIQRLFVTGPYATAMVEAFGGGARAFDSRDALVSDLMSEVHEGDVLLVKGSRSAGMDVVVTTIKEALEARGEH